MSLSLAISLTVFALIAVREWLPPVIKIWHVMVAGAAAMLATGQIAPHAALEAIDWDIILYLFSVFSIGRGLYDSGISHRIAGRILTLRSPRAALGAFIAVFAVIAALLTNDAAAVIGTPIALLPARRSGGDARFWLVVLCVTVTIGSMATPIGNPQNLLIAASGGVPAPMLTFVVWLIVPTVLCLVLAALWLARGALGGDAHAVVDEPAENNGAGPLWPFGLAVALLFVLVVGDSVVEALSPGKGIPLGIAAAIAALPPYLVSPGRWRMLRGLDWPTLAFFVAMFIVTGALLQSGSIQALLGGAQAHMDEPLVTAGISFFGSQIFSNVPLVDMYIKLLPSLDVANLMMLAAVSTLAGNVFIISAASNVIVLQMAERYGGPSIAFVEFTRLVLPVGLVSTAITMVYILAIAAITV
ncbi:MAG: SLC13 family permease [Acuticoccus sp.]